MEARMLSCTYLQMFDVISPLKFSCSAHFTMMYSVMVCCGNTITCVAVLGRKQTVIKVGLKHNV